MSSIEENFTNVLNELNNIKPPGVSGSRIKTLKEIFLNNLPLENELTSILINACKNATKTNKLGPLYVIDAITRALIDSNQESQSVKTIESQIDDLVADALLSANDDVKDKIGKLVDIWDQCHTFDPKEIENIKNKYFKSTTPPGSPPNKRNIKETNSNKDGQPHQETSAVLSALANLAAKKSPTPANIPVSTSTSSSAAATNTTSTESNPNAIFQLLQTMNKTNKPLAHDTSSSSRDRSDRNYNANANTSRQRDKSPTRHSNAPAPKPTHIEGEQNIPSNPHFRPKRPYVDNEIPQGSIGILSRTIFIGGVPHSMGERELGSTLRPYAEVQSVILNNERKHAFVKVYSRAEAEQVIQALSNNHPSGLRARWGVGFGPRDCCNYQTGISTIPLQRLTDADRKWLTTAQWGGTVPDLPIQSGLFVEEPDIEVGSGVSSKSISRKMPTNSNPNGPKSDGSNNQYQQQHHHHHHQQQQQQQQQQQHAPLPPQQQYYGSPQYQQPVPTNYYQQPNSASGFNAPPAAAPGAPVPGGVPPMNQGMNQAQMMAMMAQMMGQQQPGGANGGMDMAQMFQAMANMMQQQQQPPQ